MPAPDPRRQRGFTLMELLVSLALLGLLASLIAGGLRTGQRVWERGDRRDQMVDRVAAAQRLLRARLERAAVQPPSAVSDGSVDFTGMPAQLSFVAPPPDDEAPGTLRLYTLALRDGSLILSSVNTAWRGQREAPQRSLTLAEGVQALELAYFGAPAQSTGAPAGWQQQWRRRSTLPAAIRIRLRFSADDARRWPDLVIRPGADADVGCLMYNRTDCRKAASS